MLTASILADTLHEIGEYQAARELAEGVLARQRRVLGSDHHHTEWTEATLRRINRKTEGGR